jgi:hypothetical protein
MLAGAEVNGDTGAEQEQVLNHPVHRVLSSLVTGSTTASVDVPVDRYRGHGLPGGAGVVSAAEVPVASSAPIATCSAMACAATAVSTFSRAAAVPTLKSSPGSR